MKKLVAIFTLNKNNLQGGGVPFVVCNSKKEMDNAVMDLCRSIGATAHTIADNIFVIQR